MRSPADILQILATSAASSLELFGLEKADAIDPLQFFAEKSGLVELIGQDACQQLISAPFVHCGESSEFPLAPDAAPPRDDYASRVIQQWEMEDARDRWRHTGELPPVPSKTFALASKKYQTPQAVIDAFFHVARNESAENIAKWLGQHSVDAPFLRNLAEATCTSR